MSLFDNWQPIETVPKDGTPILAICMKALKGSEDRIGRMQVDRWHTAKDGLGFLGLGKFNSHYWPATHWTPLPEPPK